MRRPTPWEDLTDDEIRRAVTLAAEQHAREGGTATSGTLLDLSEAVAAVRAEHALEKRRLFWQRVTILGAIVALLLVVDVGFALRHRAGAAPTATATAPIVAATAPLVVTLPPPGDERLSGIPVPADFPLHIHGYDSGDPTAITFVNRTDRPVNLEFFDSQERRRIWYPIQPDKSSIAYMMFNQPLLVTDEARRILGLYYPSGVPTIAEITGPAHYRSSADLHGYLVSEDAKTFPTQAQREERDTPGRSLPSPSPHGTTAGWMTILNMRREPVLIYEMNPNGSASYLETLPPGTVIAGGTSEGTGWEVMDSHRHVLGRYRTPPVDGVAVIMPAPEK